MDVQSQAKPVLKAPGSGFYQIWIHGEVERHWEAELRLHLSYCQTELGPVSTFEGHLPDQAALLGALQWLNMWGYIILQVRYIREES